MTSDHTQHKNVGKLSAPQMCDKQRLQKRACFTSIDAATQAHGMNSKKCEPHRLMKRSFFIPNVLRSCTDTRANATRDGTQISSSLAATFYQAGQHPYRKLRQVEVARLADAFELWTL